MEQPLQLQFLDLDDLDSDEIDYVQTVLYGRGSRLELPRLELPWLEAADVQPSHWNQHQQYGVIPCFTTACPSWMPVTFLTEGGGVGECGGEAGGGGEVYPVQVPVATTIQQVYHQVVPQPIPNLTAAFVSNHLTANVNVHGYMSSNVGGYMYQGSGEGEGRGRSRGGRSGKAGGKGGRGGGSEGRRGDYVGYPYPAALVMTPPGPSPYQYHHHHLPSAQHAAGPPLYLSPAPLGMYAPGPPPPALYSGYPPPPPPPAVYTPQGHIPHSHPPDSAHHRIDKKEDVGEPVGVQVQPVQEQRQRVVSSGSGKEVLPVTTTPGGAGAREEEEEEEEEEGVTVAAAEDQEEEEEPEEEEEEGEMEEEEEEEEPAAAVAVKESQEKEVVPPPQPQEPPAQEKSKSLPPINAIKTTSLPSLPPVKRRTEEASGPSPQVPPAQPVAASGGKTWAGLFKEASPPPPHHLHHHHHHHQQTPQPQPQPQQTHHHHQQQQQQQQTTHHHHHHHQQQGGGGGLAAPQARKPPLNAVAVAPPPTVGPSLLDNSRANKPPLPPRSSLVGLPQPEPQDDPVLRRIAESLSQYELEHKAIVLTPRGLTNPSNYCYINATLQALLACPPFYNLIKTIAQNKPSNPLQHATKSHTPVIDSMVQFIKEFSAAGVGGGQRRREKVSVRGNEAPSTVEGGVGPAFEPGYVYKMLSALRREPHVEGRQEDAEEFLSLLLNGLHDEMLELAKLVVDPKGAAPLSNGDVTNGDPHTEDSSDWKEVTTKGIRITRRAEFGRTPLSDIFMGQLRSRVHRCSNEESTDNVQPFFTLQLDIESSGSVNEALEKLVGWDPVEGLGHLQYTLDTVPCVLILHLKCFDYRHDTCSKIVKALEFPVDLRLDQKLLSSKAKPAVKSRQYKLFAVVYHDGKEASKGHYLSDVFHVGSGSWIRYDDSSVRPVSESQVLHPATPRVPYLLYYRRADTINLPPRSAVRLT